MTTAQYINQSKSELATKAKRLFLLRKACPNDKYVNDMLKRVVWQCEMQKNFAEAELGWFLME